LIEPLISICKLCKAWKAFGKLCCNPFVILDIFEEMKVWLSLILVFIFFQLQAQTTLSDFKIETVSYFKQGEFEVNFLEEDSFNIHYLDYDNIWKDYNYSFKSSINLDTWGDYPYYGNSRKDILRIKGIINYPSKYYLQMPYEKGKYTGSFISIFPDASHLVSAEFIDGQLDGRVTIRDSSGMLISDRFYKNGRISCYEYEFFENRHQLAYSIECKDTNCDGDWETKRWYPNGLLREYKQRSNSELGEYKQWDSAGYLIEHFTVNDLKKWNKKILIFHAYKQNEKYYRKTYWNTGKRKTTEECGFCFNCSTIKKISYDEKGNYIKTEYFKPSVVEEEPEEVNEIYGRFDIREDTRFGGGKKELIKFLRNNFRPSTEDLYNNFNQFVLDVTFKVSRNGTVHDIKPTDSSMHGVAPYSYGNLEKTLKKTGKWRPYECRGRPYDSEIRLRFKVEQEN
jgi:hypothetical protein